MHVYLRIVRHGICIFEDFVRHCTYLRIVRRGACIIEDFETWCILEDCVQVTCNVTNGGDRFNANNP